MSIKAIELCKEYSRWIWGQNKEERFTENIIVFNLNAGNTTYSFAAMENGMLAYLYYGSKVEDEDLTYLLRLDQHPWTAKVNARDECAILDVLPLEYPCYGIGDFREACLMVEDKNGMSACDIRYVAHRIYPGKPRLYADGIELPATFASEEEAQTLEVTCIDNHLGLEITLIYTAFECLDVITRSVRLRNAGSDSIKLRRVLSACVDFDGYEYDFITLNGAWGRERYVERTPLRRGKQSVDSLRGISSAQCNPFVALTTHNADEQRGEAFGFNLVYSGNFLAEAEVSFHDRARVVMGINPNDFCWLLERGEEFTAPELVMVHSDEGIGAMSRTFHDLYRRHLIRGHYKDKRRPVLINNWEGTYFDFDTDKLLAIARQSAELGIEMLVMDDGWFGKRNSDTCSLGDWVVNEDKLKGGLGYLVSEVNALGMKFGIWFEPEMVSPDSELYRAHPEWAIHVEGRPLTMCREQYVLDYSNKEVRDYIYSMLRKVLDSANIEYVKWDMNRPLTQVGSSLLPRERQRELWHRYVLGVYDLMNRLTTDYPNILLENCSSGGGRFDPGMLFYSPQIWCSDDAEAIERLKIQYGTSLCYPVSTMGAHISDCPNHTVGRTTPFATRGDVAMPGTFGYELDVTRISQAERDAIPGQIAEFKKYNHLSREGDQYRLGNVFEDGMWDAWMFVAKDKSEALFTYVQVLNRPNYRSRKIKLAGLDPKALYKNETTGEILSGSALMNAGVFADVGGDFSSVKVHFTRV